MYKISFWQCKIVTVISEWKKFISLTHCTLIFQHSHHLQPHFFSIVLFICSFRPRRKFLVRCWSICTQLPQLRHPMKNVDLLISPSILGTTRSLTVPNLGCKEGAEPLWISGLSWHPEFVHCNVALQKKRVSFQPDSADALLEWS